MVQIRATSPSQSVPLPRERSVVVADVLLTAAEEGIPIQVLIHIAAREVAGGAQVGSRLDPGEEQRQPLRREDAVPANTGRATRLPAGHVELVGAVVLGQKIVCDREVQ